MSGNELARDIVAIGLSRIRVAALRNAARIACDKSVRPRLGRSDGGVRKREKNAREMRSFLLSAAALRTARRGPAAQPRAATCFTGAVSTDPATDLEGFVLDSSSKRRASRKRTEAGVTSGLFGKSRRG